MTDTNYYGRGIVIGATDVEQPFAAYFVTGRSPSSKARIFEELSTSNSITIETKPSDPEVLNKGNPDLLLYDALRAMSGRLVVSNGKHTSDLITRLNSGDEVNILQRTNNWSYEPDAPNFTPRISGIILAGEMHGQLGIIKRDPNTTGTPFTHTDAPIRQMWGYSLRGGLAYKITTYAGENKGPLPSFLGNPVELSIQGRMLDELVEEITPHMGNPEFRVSLAVALFNPHVRGFKTKVVNYAHPEANK